MKLKLKIIIVNILNVRILNWILLLRLKSIRKNGIFIPQGKSFNGAHSTAQINVSNRYFFSK